jgi:hypothetical protein
MSEIAFRTSTAPPDDPSLPPDDRVDCGECGNKSGHKCLGLKGKPDCVPFGILHYCDSFSAKRRK